MTSKSLVQFSIALTALLIGVSSSAHPDDTGEEGTIDTAKLEATGAIIGDIVLRKQDVFDTSDPKENNSLYRLANRLHIITRDEVIRKQLLLDSGDPYSKRLSDESERILRRTNYLYDAAITPKIRADGAVDLFVDTRDVWTLQPIISISRSGGENKTSFGLEELNFLGRGQTLRFERTDDVDRESNSFAFRDSQLGQSWVSAALQVADSSDGHSNFLSLVRPFFALDTRWSAGASALDDKRREALYDLGDEVAEYRQERDRFSAFGGWSRGLRNGWVRRYTAGVVFDDNRFSTVPNGELPAAIPLDRNLVYPFLAIELFQDQFEKAKNREQMARTEDFFTGHRLTASIGLANESIGADRDAVLYAASYGRGFGSMKHRALLVSAEASGRQESGNSKNALFSGMARYFRQQSEKRLLFATVSGTLGHDLDLDNLVELGGDTGLRGYPLRYQTGDSKILLSVEQRYFWDWYPFRLFRVGGAIFADAGRTWGENPVGSDSQGWLRDVGIGLRFAPTRTGSRKIIHLDFAFPIDGDSSIDNLQILLESKKSF